MEPETHKHTIYELEDNPLSAAGDCLFDTFATALHICRQLLHLPPKDALYACS
jgi:hypothetical protein